MNGFRSKRFGRGTACAAIALAHLLTIAAAARAGGPGGDPRQRGRGPLLSPYAEITACERAVYRGPETRLYANRPYHTAAQVGAVVGHAFCRGARHGTGIWIIDVLRPTTLVAFGNAEFGLEARGWAVSDAEVYVGAAGVALDRVYTRRVEPGRYVIRQGFTPAAPVVFWDEADVRLASEAQRSEAASDR